MILRDFVHSSSGETRGGDTWGRWAAHDAVGMGKDNFEGFSL